MSSSSSSSIVCSLAYRVTPSESCFFSVINWKTFFFFSSSIFSFIIASLHLLFTSISVLIKRKRERGSKTKNFQMNLTRGFFLRATLLLVLLAGSSGAAPFISGDALQGHGFTGRNLLQAKQNCPIAFEYMDYNIITSKCKGPQYAVIPCCSAFKEFACPYSEQLNDLTNDCSSTMFTYINLHGKYPPGLFSSECRDGKEGLDCRAYIGKADNSTSTSSAHMKQSLFPLVSVLSGFIMAFFLH